MCMEHLCTLYTYLICIYWAIIYKDMGIEVFCSRTLVASWRNNFSQLLHVHGVRDVRQTEIHTAEPLVPKPSAFEVDLAIENLKTHK